MIFHPRVRSREAAEASSRTVVLARLHRLEHADPAAIEAYTKRKLERILDHCWRRIPFYKEWFRANPGTKPRSPRLPDHQQGYAPNQSVQPCFARD